MRRTLQISWVRTERGYQVGFVYRKANGTELVLRFQHQLYNGNELGLLHRSGRALWRSLKVVVALLALWAALRTLGFA